MHEVKRVTEQINFYKYIKNNLNILKENYI